ncbi:hypothetical protein EV361DRAFT_872889 [Lentinula raphanica]|nr:hypothetical protein EV361DRAFT_872889 [Lentinula raphanica]
MTAKTRQTPLHVSDGQLSPILDEGSYYMLGHTRSRTHDQENGNGRGSGGLPQRRMETMYPFGLLSVMSVPEEHLSVTLPLSSKLPPNVPFPFCLPSPSYKSCHDVHDAATNVDAEFCASLNFATAQVHHPSAIGDNASSDLADNATQTKPPTSFCMFRSTDLSPLHEFGDTVVLRLRDEIVNTSARPITLLASENTFPRISSTEFFLRRMNNRRRRSSFTFNRLRIVSVSHSLSTVVPTSLPLQHGHLDSSKQARCRSHWGSLMNTEFRYPDIIDVTRFDIKDVTHSDISDITHPDIPTFSTRHSDIRDGPTYYYSNVGDV